MQSWCPIPLGMAMDSFFFFTRLQFYDFPRGIVRHHNTPEGGAAREVFVRIGRAPPLTASPSDDRRRGQTRRRPERAAGRAASGASIGRDLSRAPAAAPRADRRPHASRRAPPRRAAVPLRPVPSRAAPAHCCRVANNFRSAARAAAAAATRDISRLEPNNTTRRASDQNNRRAARGARSVTQSETASPVH